MTEVVAALIWQGDKFLICRRPAHKAHGLLWEFVGGKVEEGETKEEALIRECREELAVTLSVGDMFMDVIHEYPDLTVHLSLFNAVIAEGVPQMLEHSDIRWITPQEIPTYDFCPADVEILKEITARFGGKGKGNMNTNPSPQEIGFVRKALMQYNREHVGDDGHTPLCIVEYDEDGNIIGGILGGTYWGWMYVDILWVDEKHRRTGIGTRLLTEAEKEALRRGCHHVHLDTMSWQAPDFYTKHGYTVIGTLPDIPAGNRKYLLMKAL